MSDEIKLKPCPFCGSFASVYPSSEHSTAWIGGCATTSKEGCIGTDLIWEDSEPEAVAAWNTRTDTLPTWQPIETAPRDGTPFIAIGIIGGAPVVCWWKTEEVRESLREEDDSEFPWAFLEDDGILNGCKEDEHGPTHWMPIPTPPKGDTHD